jgi:hypothetical protein
MTIGDLLDGGFNVLRARPRLVLGLAALFVIPAELIAAYIARNAVEDIRNVLDTLTSNTGTTPDTGLDNWWLPYVGIALQFLSRALAGASITVVVVAWYSDEQPDGREVLRRLGPRLPSLLLAWLVAHVAIAGGAFTLLGIGGFVLMALFIVVVPIVVIEGSGAFAALSRSTSLTGRRFWPVLGFGLLSALVGVLFGQVLSAIPQLAVLVLPDGVDWLAIAVSGIISQVVTATVVGAATALLYLDLRIRREGLDVAWAADRTFPA